ncbi:SRPBCC family protein [Nodosilinea sp. LEGE 06152]|uniref:SRPBCC family protein n=1 Tax=Nodosilinea sp. LEGE 06152 TaxID=2777966 RepID=UPI00187F919B|nr:SRPBCC family protein [Nodosilinea sp. LEGE 06152]MBE9156778.1 SRPBCC family protein [Nodosilinea sp. LEGE 06152]
MTANVPDTTNLEALSLGAVDAAVADIESGAAGLDLGPDFGTPAAGVTIQTEKLEGQQRRILAVTDIPFTAEQVWQVLTDYDNLSSFIPNLSLSQRLNHPEGGIRLEQIGSQCFLNIKFCARVVLDMVEAFPKELRFSMVEGDFRQFEGRWTLEPVVDAQKKVVRLGYDLTIRPPRAMPVALIERHIRHDLTRNLKAISDRTAVVFGT